jgi:acyl carrier protein
MNSPHRMSRRTLLVVAGFAVAPSLSRVYAANARLQGAAAADPRVPAAVRSIFVEELEVEAPRVKWDARIVEDLGADSLDTVELVMAFEEAFKIEIPDEDAEKLRRVGEVVVYLRKRKVID